MEQINITKPLPELKKFKTLESKFDAVAEYLKIDHVFFITKNPKDAIKLAKSGKKVQVLEIIGPKSNYIRSLANEWIKNLSQQIRLFTQNESDYEKVRETLQRMRKNAGENMVSNDMSNSLKFSGNIRYYIQTDKGFEPIAAGSIDLISAVNVELAQHYDIRKDFYNEMNREIEIALTEHLTPINYPGKSLATWKSENDELEIAELIESLKYTHRLETSSYSKFYKAFYELFGLSSVRHDQKLQQIRKRKVQKSYLNDLAKKIESRYKKTSKS